MTRRAGAVAALLAAAAVPARAGDAPPKPTAAIRWADTFSDAVLEATERNVPIYLHSHCNT